jgi:tetratricopeptide (TPR) repeat protein
MDHRQARWNEAIRNLERAVELDPRDLENLLVAGYNYDGLHRYADARRMYERAVAVAPHDYSVRIARAWLPLSEKADIRPLRAEIDAILREEPQAAPKIAEAIIHLWHLRPRSQRH